METKKFTRAFLMVLLSAATIFSCAKEDYRVFYTGGSAFVEDTEAAGSIEDVGLINPDVRQMNVAMRDATVQVQNPAMETVLLAGDFRIAFHSVEDGLIPVGDYTFSDAINGAPYTFHTAYVETTDVEEGSYSSLEITGGVITVYQNDPQYVFIFNCLTITGDSIKGEFSGKMNYTDNHP
jgi:hypothetical protein